MSSWPRIKGLFLKACFKLVSRLQDSFKLVPKLQENVLVNTWPSIVKSPFLIQFRLKYNKDSGKINWSHGTSLLSTPSPKWPLLFISGKQVQGVSFSSCQRNLIKKNQIEAMITLITKMALIFFPETVKKTKSIKKVLGMKVVQFSCYTKLVK